VQHDWTFSEALGNPACVHCIVGAVSVFGRLYHNAHFAPPGSGAGGKIRALTTDKTKIADSESKNPRLSEGSK
jgi:hypothetical protein